METIVYRLQYWGCYGDGWDTNGNDWYFTVSDLLIGIGNIPNELHVRIIMEVW